MNKIKPKPPAIISILKPTTFSNLISAPSHKYDSLVKCLVRREISNAIKLLWVHAHNKWQMLIKSILKLVDREAKTWKATFILYATKNMRSQLIWDTPGRNERGCSLHQSPSKCTLMRGSIAAWALLIMQRLDMPCWLVRPHLDMSVGTYCFSPEPIPWTSMCLENLQMLCESLITTLLEPILKIDHPHGI